MPWTLYRYILKDLAKIFCLVTAILLLVVSFATAVKPLNEGLLEPVGILRFICYTMPTVLTIILPFSGVFAVTMVFCRLVADNEMTAAQASGLSTRLVLLPVLVVGLVLTLGTFYLNNWVVPIFYRKVASLLEQDITDLLVKHIGQQKAVELSDGVMLYAERCQVQPAAGSPSARVLGPAAREGQRRIMVRGVVLGQFSPDGQLLREATAEAADIIFDQEPDGSKSIQMWFESAMAYDPARGVVQLPGTVKSSRMYLRSRFRDDPKFLAWNQLIGLGRDPDRYDRVRERSMSLARAIAGHQVLRDLAATLGQGGQVDLNVEHRQSYKLSAPQVAWQGSQSLVLRSLPGLPVRLGVTEAGTVHSAIAADLASVRIAVESFDPLVRLAPADAHAEPVIELMFERPLVWDLQQPGPPVRHTTIRKRVTWPVPVAGPMSRYRASQLLAMLEPGQPYHGIRAINLEAQRLKRNLDRLRRKIVAQINLRGASATAVVLFLMTAALLSLRMGRRLPLVVYFWTFLITIAVVVIIHSGENLMTNLDLAIGAGLAVSWMGTMLLGVVVVMLYGLVTRRGGISCT